MGSPNRVYLDWPRLDKFRVFCEKLDIPTPDTIVAVARGGLPPAVILSNLYPEAWFQTIDAKSYVGVHKRHDVVLRGGLVNPEKVLGATVLVVDDIVDTGATISAVADFLYSLGAERVFCVTLVNKCPAGVSARKHVPVWGLIETADTKWYYFPWEEHTMTREL